MYILFCVTFHSEFAFCQASSFVEYQIFDDFNLVLFAGEKRVRSRFHDTNLPTCDMTVHDTYDDMRKLAHNDVHYTFVLWLIAIALHVQCNLVQSAIVLRDMSDLTLMENMHFLISGVLEWVERYEENGFIVICSE